MSLRHRPLALLLNSILCLATGLSAIARDYHIKPVASGTADGSSWANAAGPDKWTSLTGQLQAGDTLSLGSGTYQELTLALAKSGTAESPIMLKGEDTGGGLPILNGSWDKQKPGAGPTFLTLQFDTGHVQVKDLRVHNYRSVVYACGRNSGLVISGLDVRDTRIGLLFIGGTLAGKPEVGSKNILIQDCNFTGFTKSAARFEEGVHEVNLIDCHSDAGGKDYATELFHMGFLIKGDHRVRPDPSQLTPDHDFTFTRCTARNAYNTATWHRPDDVGAPYWNGDGFVAESGVYNITFIDCMAFDNTDGGWDVKATDVVLRGCVSFRNKRNYRVWANAKFENCIAGYPFKRGGSGDAANLGIYHQGVITLDRCTLVGDLSPFSIELKNAAPGAVHIRLKDSLVIADGAEAPQFNNRVEAINTLVFGLDKAPKGPVFATAPLSSWDGKGTAFDAQAAYGTLGFRRGGEPH